jgi:hypothetical protein
MSAAISEPALRTRVSDDNSEDHQWTVEMYAACDLGFRVALNCMLKVPTLYLLQGQSACSHNYRSQIESPNLGNVKSGLQYLGFQNRFLVKDSPPIALN